jgi:glutamine amidotransferase
VSETGATTATDPPRGSDPPRGTDVVIIASGGANIASLQFALGRLGVTATLSADAARIRAATHVILPGVGAAADAMQRLRAAELDRVIPALTQPVLGICLGMQLLHTFSDEGRTDCLGVIAGRAQRFPEDPDRPVPHMGWNTLHFTGESPLFAELPRDAWAYFVHSYALPCAAATIATTDYGAPFSAVVQWRNFFGVQFHPERSGAAGARLLRNFLARH